MRVLEGRFVIEQAPIRPGDGAERGVVAEGAVGTRAAGRFRLFRYEVRRWRDGIIPDVAEAVESPHRLSENPDHARRLLELVPQVPTPVWGRDGLGCEPTKLRAASMPQTRLRSTGVGQLGDGRVSAARRTEKMTQ